MNPKEIRWSIRSQLSYLNRLYLWYLDDDISELGYPFSYTRVAGNLIHFDGINQRELAEECFLAPTSLTNVLRNMESDGLIRREKGGWRGETLIYITEKGAALHASVHEKLKNINLLMMKDLHPDEVATFQKVLFKISENMKEDSAAKGRLFFPHIQIRKIGEKFLVEKHKK